MLSIFSQLIFGSQNIFGNQSDHFKSLSWRDKSLSFDLRSTDIELNDGEQLIACFYPIEDIKGNPDGLGLLKVTNLRLIWICCAKKRVNLSIGWRTVSLTFRQNLKDSLGQPITSLCILTEYESTKYEFVFNKMPAIGNDLDSWTGQVNWTALRKFKRDKSLSISHLSPMYLDDPFDVVFRVWQSYKQTQLFRHCRANLSHLLSNRGSRKDQPSGSTVVTDVMKLPSEDVIELYSEIVHHESRSTRHQGFLMLTNIRMIWIDEALPLRNMSIPYIRINSMKLKQSDRLLISTLDYLATSSSVELRSKSGSMKHVFEQAQNLYTVFRSRPRFGPESCEDCINFMSNLRPIENYFDSLDEFAPPNIPGIDPAGERMHSKVLETTDFSPRDDSRSDGKSTADEDDELAEGELAAYSSRLNHYLNEKPIEHDQELLYSMG